MYGDNYSGIITNLNHTEKSLSQQSFSISCQWLNEAIRVLNFHNGIYCKGYHFYMCLLCTRRNNPANLVCVMTDSPSSTSSSLPVHSWPGKRHSTLYLIIGTPPIESGSSNFTTAVLEKGSTCWITGDDGTSATANRENNVLILFFQFSKAF